MMSFVSESSLDRIRIYNVCKSIFYVTKIVNKKLSISYNKLFSLLEDVMMQFQAVLEKAFPDQIICKKNPEIPISYLQNG
jgi:hypothetical protein